MKTAPVLLTCEHGGYEIPDRFKSLFSGYDELLKSHMGWDPGALELTRALADRLGAPVFYSEVSRLVVELNRSETNRSLFSTFTRVLTDQERQEILNEFYYPFRKKVFDHISKTVQQGKFILHISVHSFTPELNSKIRNADIGLLYDPSRKCERDIAARLATSLKSDSLDLRIRFNYPYRGIADGHTTALRKKFGPGEYAGLELEVNQNALLDNTAEIRKIADRIAKAILSAFNQPVF